MANSTVAALTAASTLDGTELYYGVQSGGDVKVTGAQIKTLTSASPTLVTPTLGVATATSINKVTLTQPANGSTLTIQDGFTLTAAANITLASQPPVLGANTFTALQTITQASVNAGVLASTGWSLTGTNATNMVDLAGTANTAGNYTALKVAITNTASGSAAKLLDLLSGAGGATSRLSVDLPGNVVLGSAAIATNATDGFLYIPSCAGTPTGTPTAFTGRVPIVFDTSANVLWAYDGSWLQPKTAGTLINITWQ